MIIMQNQLLQLAQLIYKIQANFNELAMHFIQIFIPIIMSLTNKDISEMHLHSSSVEIDLQLSVL